MTADSFRYHFGLKCLLALFLIALLPLFFFGGPDWASRPLYQSAWNLGHIVFFSVFALLLHLFIRVGDWRRWWTISLAVLVVGLGIEYMQSFVERQVHWGDILRNLIGAWLVLAWYPPGDESVRHKRRTWAVRGAASLLLIFELSTVGLVALDQYRVAHQLPLLADLENPEAVRHWSGAVEHSRKHSSEGDSSLAIHLSRGRYSGVSLTNMPADWRGYERISFKLFNPGPGPLALTLRLNDQQHDRGRGLYSDRFNTHFIAQQGWNQFHFELAAVQAAPESREMNMDNMRRLGLFTARLGQPRTIYLDELRLE